MAGLLFLSLGYGYFWLSISETDSGQQNSFLDTGYLTWVPVEKLRHSTRHGSIGSQLVPNLIDRYGEASRRKVLFSVSIDDAPTCIGLRMLSLLHFVRDMGLCPTQIPADRHSVTKLLQAVICLPSSHD